MNNFQTILIASFLAFFIFGVLIFSGLINIGNSGKSTIAGKVTIWGTIPYDQAGELFKDMGGSNGSVTIDYTEQDKTTYQQNLIEAFAKDQGPDLFILTPDMLLKNKTFISEIPYASYSQSLFKTNYIDGADILLDTDGFMGYPLLVDPIVLYYNKNILANNSVLYPPSTWDDLINLSTTLIKRDPDGTLSQKMIGLGEYDNVNHSKDLLSLILIQSGNPMVTTTDKGYRMTLKDDAPDKTYPFEQVINFFLGFSNPSKDSYTWDRSMPNSFDVFTSNKLAFYLGYSSELFKIKSMNPNMSFDVTSVPQPKGTDTLRTYGNIYTLVANKKSKNLNSAFGVASLITDPANLKELGIRASLPTASRALLSVKPSDPYLLTFFNSAIISHSWLDPDREQTDSIFRNLIENSLSNKLSVVDAIDKASGQMDLIIKNYNKK